MQRKLSLETRAAHVLLPRLSALLTQMRAEAARVAQESPTGRDRDAKSDWAEIRLRASARAEGAERIVELVRQIARE